MFWKHLKNIYGHDLPTFSKLPLHNPSSPYSQSLHMIQHFQHFLLKSIPLCYLIPELRWEGFSGDHLASAQSRVSLETLFQLRAVSSQVLSSSRMDTADSGGNILQHLITQVTMETQVSATVFRGLT